MKKLFFILIVLLFASNCLFAIKYDLETLYKNSVPSVVSILSNKASIGTGFFINKSKILTAYHVVEDLILLKKKIMIELYQKKIIKGRAITIFKKHDIALIEIEKQEDISPLKIKFQKEFNIGTQVILIGQGGYLRENLLGNWSFSTGYISQYDRELIIDLYSPPFTDLIQLDIKGVPGLSGSPIINTSGEVIGILQFGIPGSYSWGTTLYVIKDYIKRFIEYK